MAGLPESEPELVARVLRDNDIAFRQDQLAISNERSTCPQCQFSVYGALADFGPCAEVKADPILQQDAVSAEEIKQFSCAELVDGAPICSIALSNITNKLPDHSLDPDINPDADKESLTVEAMNKQPDEMEVTKRAQIVRRSNHYDEAHVANQQMQHLDNSVKEPIPNNCFCSDGENIAVEEASSKIQPTSDSRTHVYIFWNIERCSLACADIVRQVCYNIDRVLGTDSSLSLSLSLSLSSSKRVVSVTCMVFYSKTTHAFSDAQIDDLDSCRCTMVLKQAKNDIDNALKQQADIVIKRHLNLEKAARPIFCIITGDRSIAETWEKLQENNYDGVIVVCNRKTELPPAVRKMRWSIVRTLHLSIPNRITDFRPPAILYSCALIMGQVHMPGSKITFLQVRWAINSREPSMSVEMHWRFGNRQMKARVELTSASPIIHIAIATLKIPHNSLTQLIMLNHVCIISLRCSDNHAQ